MNMTSKRYRQRKAATLLMTVLNLLRTQQPSTAQIRRVYTRVLQAPLSDFAVPRETITALRSASSETLLKWGVLTHRDIERAFFESTKAKATVEGVTLRLSRDGAVEVFTTPSQAMLLQVVALLRLVGVKRLVECDCGNVFVRVGKRRACSPRCQRRVYMRRYRVDGPIKNSSLESRTA
jgi:hypothetical protein